VIAALVGNFVIAIAKFATFLVTGSSSMLAEPIHSVADSGNQGLLLRGGRAARRVADDRHQSGFGRERYFWSFVVALVLFVLGSGFAIYEGIEKIRHPHPITNVAVALGVLAFAICVGAFSFSMAVRAARPLKGRMSWWRFIRRSRSPELPVVLLEDLGAQIGSRTSSGGSARPCPTPTRSTSNRFRTNPGWSEPRLVANREPA
jgi:cation diffusion facilitator family transporter